MVQVIWGRALVCAEATRVTTHTHTHTSRTFTAYVSAARRLWSVLTQRLATFRTTNSCPVLRPYYRDKNKQKREKHEGKHEDVISSLTDGLRDEKSIQHNTIACACRHRCVRSLFCAPSMCVLVCC